MATINEICDVAGAEFLAARRDGICKEGRLTERRQYCVDCNVNTDELETSSLEIVLDRWIRPAMTVLAGYVESDVIFLRLESPEIGMAALFDSGVECRLTATSGFSSIHSDRSVLRFDVLVEPA